MTVEEAILEDPRFDGTRTVQLAGIGGTGGWYADAMYLGLGNVLLIHPSQGKKSIPTDEFIKSWGPENILNWLPQKGDLIRIFHPSVQDHAKVLSVNGNILTLSPSLSNNYGPQYNQYDYDLSTLKVHSFDHLNFSVAPRIIQTTVKDIYPNVSPTPPPVQKYKIPQNAHRSYCARCGGPTNLLLTSHYCPVCE